MARPAATRLVAVLLEGPGCLVAARRGYSAVAAAGKKEAVASAASGKTGAGEGEAPSSAPSWVPDPDTGCYRPASRTPDVDVAELRRRLLTRRSRE